MQLLTLLTLLPAAALATSYCPRDFVFNATMAEGPCSRSSTAAAVRPTPVRPSSPLASLSLSNGTTAAKTGGDFRLWKDDVYGLETAPVSRMHGAIAVASKMDLGIYAPVCAGEGVCGKKMFA